MTQIHVERPMIPLIRIKNDDKSDKYFVKLNICKDPLSSSPDLYEFKMVLFENGEPK